MSYRYFAAPQAGDVVLVKFPDQDPKKKGQFFTHPAIVIQVLEPEDPAKPIHVKIAVGTTNRTQLYDGDVEILRHQHPVEFARSGLLRDTRFKLNNLQVFAYTTEHFIVAPYREYGSTPKVGTLHPDTLKRVEAAMRVWKSSPFNHANAGKVKGQSFSPRSVR